MAFKELDDLDGRIDINNKPLRMAAAITVALVLWIVGVLFSLGAGVWASITSLIKVPTYGTLVVSSASLKMLSDNWED